MASASGVSATHPSEFRVKKVADHMAIIESVAINLVALGVPKKVFEEANFVANGFSDSKLASYLQPFVNVTDDSKIERILDIGKKKGIFQAVRGMRSAAFYKFILYLRTPEGTDELHLLAAQEKLAKRGGPMFGPDEQAWLSMWEVIRNDCANAITDARKVPDAKIADLERQLLLARKELDDVILSVKAEHPPINLYKPMVRVDLNKLCWEEYQKELVRNGEKPVRANLELGKAAYAAFRDVVEQHHVIGFLQDVHHSDLLSDYIRRKVFGAKEAGDKKAVRKFRTYLACVGLRETVSISAEGEEGDTSENSVGEDAAGDDGDFDFDQDLGDTEGATADREEAVRGKADAQPVKEERGKQLEVEVPISEREARKRKRDQDDRQAADPRGKKPVGGRGKKDYRRR